MNNRGQLAAWEAFIILVLLALVVGLGFLYAKKPSEVNKYEANSKPMVVEVKPSMFGCASLEVERYKDAVSNKVKP